MSSLGEGDHLAQRARSPGRCAVCGRPGCSVESRRSGSRSQFPGQFPLVRMCQVTWQRISSSAQSLSKDTFGEPFAAAHLLPLQCASPLGCSLLSTSKVVNIHGIGCNRFHILPVVASPQARFAAASMADQGRALPDSPLTLHVLFFLAMINQVPGDRSQ